MKLIRAAGRRRPPPRPHIVSKDAQYAGVLRAQISSYCPLRSMQQQASEQAGATNGAVY